MIVADANVLVYLLVQTPQTRLAEKWAEFDPKWCLPELWRFEFTNAVMTFVRSGKLSSAEGEDALSEAIELFSPMELRVDPIVAYRTALRFRISPYDANYICLAELLGVRCVTADKQLLERVPRWTQALSDIRQN